MFLLHDSSRFLLGQFSLYPSSHAEWDEILRGAQMTEEEYREVVILSSQAKNLVFSAS